MHSNLPPDGACFVVLGLDGGDGLERLLAALLRHIRSLRPKANLFLDSEARGCDQPSRRDLPLMVRKSNATML